MDEPLKCPHGADVCALPDGEPYFLTPCSRCDNEEVVHNEEVAHPTAPVLTFA